MKTYWLEAADVLFFRDGRSFDAGEAHAADGASLPGGSVLAGAVRSALLARRLPPGKTMEDYAAECEQPLWREVTAAIGRPGAPGPFWLQGPFPGRRLPAGGVETLLPWPRDAVTDREGRLELLRPGRLAAGTAWSQEGLRPLARRRRGKAAAAADEEPDERPEALPAAQLGDYLADKDMVVASRTSGWATEERVGIERSESGAVLAGRLYGARFLRFAPDWGLAFVTGADLGERGLLKLGGEHRAAFYEALDAPPWAAAAEALRREVVRTGRLRLYCATETAFAQGWLPDAFCADTLRLKAEHPLAADGVEAALVAAATGKAVSRQGWDLAVGAPKAVVRCVPAGSVYFLQCPPGEGAGLLFDRLHGGCAWQQTAAVADAAQRAAFGGGLVFAGVWNEGEEE